MASEGYGRALQLKQNWVDRDRIVNDCRLVRSMRHSILAPKDFLEVVPIGKLPDLLDIGQRVTSMLTERGIKSQWARPSTADRWNTWSTFVEGATDALRERLFRATNTSFWMNMVGTTLSDGISVQGVFLNLHNWANLPSPDLEDPDYDEGEYSERFQNAKGLAPLPFFIHSFDPLSYYPDYDGLGALREAAIFARHLRRDLEGLEGWQLGREVARPEQIGAPPSSSEPTVELCQLWDSEKCRYYLDGDLVSEMSHPYKRVPFFIARGLAADYSEMRLEGYPLIYPVRDVLREMESLGALKSGHIYRTAMQILKRFIGQREEALSSRYPELMAELSKVDLDELVVLPEGSDLQFLENRGVGPDIDERMGFLSLTLAKALAQDVIRGEQTSATETATGYQTRTYSAQRKYGPVLDNCLRTLQEMFSFIFDLIEYVIEDEIVIYGMQDPRNKVEKAYRIGPADLQGRRNFKFMADSGLPSAQMEVARFHMAAYREGDISKRYMAEQSGWDYDLMEKEIEEEDFKRKFAAMRDLLVMDELGQMQLLQRAIGEGLTTEGEVQQIGAALGRAREPLALGESTEERRLVGMQVSPGSLGAPGGRRI